MPGIPNRWTFLSPTAQRVMTGAPIPPGADAVCMVERTREFGDDAVQISVALRPGENVRDTGADVNAGEVCVSAGAALSPAHLGVLVSAGVKEIRDPTDRESGC